VLSDPYVKQPSRVLSDVWSWLSITCPRRNCFQDVSLEGSCKGRCSELLHPATNSKVESCGGVYLHSLFRCVGSKWFKHTLEKVLIDWIYGLCQNIVSAVLAASAPYASLSQIRSIKRPACLADHAKWICRHKWKPLLQMVHSHVIEIEITTVINLTKHSSKLWFIVIVYIYMMYIEYSIQYCMCHE